LDNFIGFITVQQKHAVMEIEASGSSHACRTLQQYDIIYTHNNATLDGACSNCIRTALNDMNRNERRYTALWSY